MMSKIRIIVSVFLIVMTAGCVNRLKYESPEGKVGDWLEYEVQSVQYGPRTIRYAITGTDSVKGETYYWLEMIITMGESQIIHKE